ncbi:TonB-dependent receptor [Colwellia sp. 1_MG-2023]|uniref:TonB-dependent receptor n=1 Tax=unclassified Colwellia TaxID=196834 RepID=UPI001C0934B0|nr:MULTISPECIES: TonB-dependent receptor [unclassified Colwellia]MBU2925337.1 TonB-dependent receptor [Colwellia sp. C2M11]MDO6650767.1 TonB-dependent receptor [Colwellia sp. 3_MG-2023]MDO6663802.1 TonB-dependent receptor [Colwellia sp. 2_MG-2023]MDO6688153.1 TonB-dependent receptor [Colwellia sp. 1_MG-2023]
MNSNKLNISLVAISIGLQLNSFSTLAQENISTDQEIEQIIVTAQRTTKNLEDIPDAISVVAGEELDKLNVANMFDLSDQVPGLVVSSVQGYRPSITIRGVGNEIPDNAGTKPAVAFHIDGIFMTNDYALWSDLVDIDRVEVQRGPDGTIYGNSSTGGAVNIVTSKPEINDNSGFTDFTFGQYDTMNFRSGVKIGLSDSVAISLSASHRQHDGYSENKALNSDNELDEKNDTTLRGQLLWQPNDDLELMVQYMQFSSDTNGPALKGNYDTISDDPRIIYHDTSEFYKLDNELLGLHLNYNFDETILKGIFSRQTYDMRRRLDMDRSSLTANDPAPIELATDNIPNLLGQMPIQQFIGNLTQEDTSYTAELNLLSNYINSDFSWNLGAFYLDTEIFSNTRNFFDADRDGETINEIIQGPNIFVNNSDIDFVNSDYRNFSSHSFFGQISYAINNNLSLTGGLRYTKNTFTDERCSLNCVPERSPITSTPSNKTDNITGRVAIDYSINENAMVYGTIATGVKPAGSNSSTDLRFFPEVFDQEKVTAYELGSKSKYLNNQLQANIAAFYYDYKDYLFESSGIGRFNSGASNLPKAEIYGLELETLANITESLSVSANFTWMGSKITEGRDAIDRAEAENASVGLIVSGASNDEINAAREATAVDLTGNKLAKIPEFVANIRATHQYDLNNGSMIRSSLSYNFRGDYYSRVFNSEIRDLVDSYSMVNANIAFFPAQSSWTVALNIQNLFDKDAISSLHTDTFGIGVTSAQYLPPRVVSLTMKYEF